MTTLEQPVEPLFVLSCERAGSTLLRYILDTHPEVCAPGELLLGGACRSLTVIVARTLGQAIPEAELPAFAYGEVRRMLSDVMERYAKSKGKRIWCDKTPFNLAHLENIHGVFPDTKYICLYRNCMDVVQSALEVSQFGFMYEFQEYVQRSPENLVEAMIESWLAKTRKEMAFEAANPTKCFRVKYESLVFDTHAILHGLFGFLGCTWQPELLDKVFTSHHDQGGGDRKIHNSTKIESSSVGRGSTIPLERISEGTLRRMNEVLAELGYPTVDADWGKVPSPYRPATTTS